MAPGSLDEELGKPLDQPLDQGNAGTVANLLTKLTVDYDKQDLYSTEVISLWKKALFNPRPSLGIMQWEYLRDKLQQMDFQTKEHTVNCFIDAFNNCIASCLPGYAYTDKEKMNFDSALVHSIPGSKPELILNTELHSIPKSVPGSKSELTPNSTRRAIFATPNSYQIKTWGINLNPSVERLQEATVIIAAARPIMDLLKNELIDGDQLSTESLLCLQNNVTAALDIANYEANSIRFKRINKLNDLKTRGGSSAFLSAIYFIAYCVMYLVSGMEQLFESKEKKNNRRRDVEDCQEVLSSVAKYAESIVKAIPDKVSVGENCSINMKRSSEQMKSSKPEKASQIMSYAIPLSSVDAKTGVVSYKKFPNVLYDRIDGVTLLPYVQDILQLYPPKKSKSSEDDKNQGLFEIATIFGLLGYTSAEIKDLQKQYSSFVANNNKLSNTQKLKAYDKVWEKLLAHTELMAAIDKHSITQYARGAMTLKDSEDSHSHIQLQYPKSEASAYTKNYGSAQFSNKAQSVLANIAYRHPKAARVMFISNVAQWPYFGCNLATNKSGKIDNDFCQESHGLREAAKQAGIGHDMLTGHHKARLTRVCHSARERLEAARLCDAKTHAMPVAEDKFGFTAYQYALGEVYLALKLVTKYIEANKDVGNAANKYWEQEKSALEYVIGEEKARSIADKTGNFALVDVTKLLNDTFASEKSPLVAGKRAGMVFETSPDTLTEASSAQKSGKTEGKEPPSKSTWY